VYERMAALARRLTHLPPPSAFEGLRLDRFSPNFDEADARGCDDVRPLAPYAYIYDVPADALHRLAYFFQFRHRAGHDPAALAAPLLRALQDWRRQHRDTDLFSVALADRLLIWDLRPRAPVRLVELVGLDRALYEMCDRIADVATLAQHPEAEGPDDVRHRLDRMVSEGVLLNEQDKYLAIAVPVGEYQPPAHIMARLFREIRAGVRTPGGTSIRVDGRLPRAKFGAAHFATDPDGSVVVRGVVRGPA
jgi:hypothetical protein